MADKTVIVRIAIKAGGLTSGLGQAGSAVRGFGADVNKAATGAASSAQALGLTSAAMGKLIVLGIGGAMAVSAKAAIDFESSLTSVAKTTDLAGEAFDKANSPLATFGQAMRNLALRVPVNVNDLNEIAALGGQLGIQVPNLVAFTDTVARLAVSTNLSTTEAATGLARIANIMRTPQTDFERLGSVVVELGNNFATTEAEILSFGLRISPVAAALGSSEEAVFGLSAALTSLGIPAERGGTAVQRVFVSMASAIEAGGESLQNWADTAGVSVDEFVEAFEKEPADAFALFVRGLNDINESGGSVFGTLRRLEIQEQRTIQVLLAAAGGYRIVGDALATAKTEGEEVNALQEESARRFGTTASQLQLLGAAFNDLRIEVGGAILGSGGLTAAIDVLREFFGIITDNIDSVISMGQAIALLAFGRLALGLGGLVTKAIAAVNAMKGLVTATGAMQTAMALSNVAIGAAALGIGILLTRWANAAIAAAELRGRVRALNQAIEDGADPVDAFVDSLREQDILSEKARASLLALDITDRDFAEAMLQGKDASDLLTDSMFDQMNQAVALRDAVRSQSGGEGTGFLTEEQKNLIIFHDLMQTATEDTNALFEMKKNNLINLLEETQGTAQLTRHEMSDLVDQAFDLFGLGVSENVFVDWATGALKAMGSVSSMMRERMGDAFKGAASQGDFIGAMFGRGEEGINALDDWSDSITDVIGDMNSRLDDQFAEVRDTIIGGMPTSADYEQVADLTRGGLDKIIAAMDLYLQDTMNWTIARNDIMGRVSLDTLSWFDSLDPATQGAWGRLFTEDRAMFEKYVGLIEGQFAEAGMIVQSQWEAMLPSQLKASFMAVYAVLDAETEKLGLSGADSVDAMVTGIETQMEAMGPEVGAQYLEFLIGIFSDPALSTQFGFDAMDPIIQGMLLALMGLSERAAPIITREVGSVFDKFNSEAQITSPSKRGFMVGANISQGLIAGVEDTLSDWNPAVFKTQIQPKIESLIQPQVNLTTQAPQRHVSIKIDHSMPGKTSHDLQTAGIIGSVLANT